MLTIEHLRTVLHYDQNTGIFTWIAPTRGNRKFGAIAGSFISEGYRRIRISGIQYFSHRLAWFYMMGEWPKCEIDHIDDNKANNAWANLRLSTNQENTWNRTIQKNNKTGFKGVFLNKKLGKYQAQIRCGGASGKYLGTFDTAQEAAHVYNKAAIRLHGEFACLNPIGEDYAN